LRAGQVIAARRLVSLLTHPKAPVQTPNVSIPGTGSDFGKATLLPIALDVEAPSNVLLYKPRLAFIRLAKRDS
jgi:hypothetical protein